MHPCPLHLFPCRRMKALVQAKFVALVQPGPRVVWAPEGARVTDLVIGLRSNIIVHFFLRHGHKGPRIARNSHSSPKDSSGIHRCKQPWNCT